MQIKSNSCSVELSSNDKCRSFWINPEIHGYGASLRFVKGDWTILHCREKGSNMLEKILILPNDDWIRDAEEMGFEVISKITTADS